MDKKDLNTTLEELLICAQTAMRRFCDFPWLRKALHESVVSSQVHLLAIGKDGGRMCEVALDVLKDRLLDAWCLTKYDHYRCLDPRIVHLEAGHPVPDENSIEHSRRIVEWMQNLSQEAELIVMLSGGGSSLFELPRNGLDLNRLISLNRDLLRSGLGIAAVNASREKLSRLKGGGALDFFQGRRLRVFALSDVEGDDPAVIASGPFTPRLHDERVSYQVIGNNLSYRYMLKEEVARLGYEVILDPAFLSGDPANLDKMVKSRLEKKPPQARVIIWGGELPIKARGEGKGGRCTHLALEMASLLADYPGAAFIALATDGSDNISGSAGAWVDSVTAAKVKQAGIDLDQALKNSDSFRALYAVGQIIPTGTWHANVNDVFLLVHGKGLTP